MRNWMRMFARVASAAVVVLGLVGTASCGSKDKETPARSEPSTVQLSITIVDTGSLELYFNLDNSSCTSRSFSDALDGEKTPVPTVVVKDSSGKIVATPSAPEGGGTFTKGTGCRVELPAVEVPRSSFYQVTVTGGVKQDVTRTATAKTRGSTAEVEVQF